eukprot:COSAG05_NODE_2047_length_3643_cov_3.595655_2_plen_471_part_00
MAATEEGVPPEPEPAPEAEASRPLIKEGWAYKSNAGKKEKSTGKDKDRKEKWQQRYFIISNQPLPHVKYYKSDKAAKAGKPPTGEVPLDNATAEVEKDPDHVGEFLLHIQHADRHLKLRFGDPAAVEEWKAFIMDVGGSNEMGAVASKIGAHVRGRAVRKEIQTQKESSTVIAKHIRGRQARAEVDKKKNRVCLENFKPTSPLDVRAISLITARRERAARDRSIAEKSAARGKGEPPAPPPKFLDLDYEPLSQLVTTIEAAFTAQCQNDIGLSLNKMSMDNLSPLLKDLGLDDINSNDRKIARVYQQKDDPAGINFYTDRAKSSLGNLDQWTEGELSRHLLDNGVELGEAEGDLGLLKQKTLDNERRSKEMQVEDVLCFLFIAQVDRITDYSKFEKLATAGAAFDTALQAFDACDPEGDGAVVLAELKRVMAQDKASALADAIGDANGDGYVSFPEFCIGVVKWHKSVYG